MRRPSKPFTRGSGKTLLLASTYHEMRRSGPRGFYLDTSHREMLQLSGWFNQVADHDQDWPLVTVAGDTREFTFDVCSRAGSGPVHRVLKLGYLEYAGGVLTEPRPPGEGFQEEFLDRIRSADALFGIIDGFHLRQWADGLPQGRNRLQHSLTTMVTLMLSEQRPITFVITKWDLLRDLDADEDARLAMVRKLLMTKPDFRELVKVHSNTRVVRLIPVSAVGPDFAGLNADGLVEKLPHGEMRPTDVDAPLSAVVPDIFEQVERQVDQARLQVMAGFVSEAELIEPDPEDLSYAREAGMTVYRRYLSAEDDFGVEPSAAFVLRSVLRPKAAAPMPPRAAIGSRFSRRLLIVAGLAAALVVAAVTTLLVAVSGGTPAPECTPTPAAAPRPPVNSAKGACRGTPPSARRQTPAVEVIQARL